MSSSMQAYRTELAVAQSDFYAAINAVLAEVFDGWLTSSQIETESGYTDYKISTNLWLRVKTGGIYYVCDNVESSYIADYSSGSYSYNLTVLKVNHCLVFCINYNTSSGIPQYTNKANFVIDSIDNDNGFGLSDSWSFGYAYLIDTKAKLYTTVHSSFTNNSYNSNSTTLQVTPFIISIDGAKCDNLYNIAITPLNLATFASFNNQIWWINDGHFALCAGDSEPTYTVVTPTS